MTDIATIYAGVIGAAVGALGTQVTGVIQTISKSRARLAKTAVAKATAAEAKRRPQYENLIHLLNRAAAIFMDLRRSVNKGPLGDFHKSRYNEALSQVMHEIYLSGTAIRIDGSPRARKITRNLMPELTSYIEDLTVDERLEPERITSMITMLNQAEESLIDVAHDDFNA
jgi:hypothetical protein